MEEIEKLKKENETYIIQLKDEREKLEISKRENNDLINKNRSLDSERNSYKNSNGDLNSQIYYVRLFIII